MIKHIFKKLGISYFDRGHSKILDVFNHVMKYLFDENCSPSNKFLNAHPVCENVKYRLQQGIKDEAILEHVSNHEFVIVTKDIRFALDAVSKKFKVIFHHVEKNKDYFLQAGEFESELISEFKKFEFK